MKVNFFLKDTKKQITSIDVIIRYRGQRYKFPAKVSVEVEFWDKATHRARKVFDYTDHVSINMQLDKIEMAAKKVFFDADISCIMPEAKQVEAACTFHKKKADPAPTNPGFLNYFVEYYQTHGYSDETKRNFIHTANFIQQYEQRTRKRLEFDDITVRFYNDFRTFILSLKKPKTDPDRPDESYSLNYFGAQVKNIKTVMREYGPEGQKLHTNTEYKHRQFIKPNEEADTVYLTQQELTQITELQLSVEALIAHDPKLTVKLAELKMQSLTDTRNMFLIGCYTALRISDFSRLQRYNFGDKYIRIKPKKGVKKNEDVVIPIHHVIKQIVENGFDFTRTKSTQKLNERVKELCQLAGITELVTTVRTEGGRQVSRTTEKYKLISSHTARRSGATNMFIAGIPAISIMKITGHRTERSFLKYIRISQEENARLLANHAFFM